MSGPAVTVAVCTYRRPAQLAALLPVLAREARSVDPPAEVVVVDNDPDGGARADVAAVADVRYEHEPRVGLAAARNRALDAAAAADLLVFVDDDEIPAPGWLAALVRAWEARRPAAVTGPVVSRFATPPPAWVTGSGAFARRTLPTGTPLHGAATNNLLLDLGAVRAAGLRFDDRFGLTGGEDTMFTHALVAAGGRIEWCDEAEVHEAVPAGRATRGWVLRRSFRAGASWSAVDLALAGGSVRRGRTRASLAAKAGYGVGRFALAVLRATVRGDVGARALATTRLVSYAGLAAGATGFGMQEYRRDAAPRDGTTTVLVAHPGAELYGSDRVVLETALGLAAAPGLRVVVTVPEAGPLTELATSQGIPCEICPTPVLRKALLRPAGLLRLLADTARATVAGRRLLQREHVDVVLVNTVTVPWWLVLARLPPRRATLCHVHEAERSAPAPLRRALAAPLRLAGVVVANSRFSVDVLASTSPATAARAVVVPNPVPGPPAVEPARTGLTGPVRLLFVGRLSPRKGPDVAVEALARLVADGVDARLALLGSVFAGYEWFAADLEAAVTRHGLADRVEFLGFADDVWPHLAACDVVVVPSTVDEPFGNTAVEAARAARPAVVSATSGLLEASEGYPSMVRVPPADPAALAAAVRRIVAEWPAFRAAALTAADLAADRHDPAAYRARMAELVARARPR